MQTVTAIADVRARIRAWRAEGARVAFVPTTATCTPATSA